MSSESETPIYVLDDNDLNSEVSRLKIQYLYFKTVFDFQHRTACGQHQSSQKSTGAWALDFVSQPNFRDRDVQVFACDISSAKFPQAGKPDVDKVRFFEHDVTKPFPDEMLGTFDLVNMSCMCFALTVQGWKSALQNLHMVEPGGHLTLRDIDSMVFTHENPPPLEGQEPDIVAYSQGKSTLATINRIFSSWALRQGFVVRAKRDVSFGVHGVFLPELSQVLNVVTSAMMTAGCLELGDGTRITDEEERKALMRELRVFVERGVLLPLSEWVVVRPLGS
ncbi:hypothetical protein EDB89DRAFT_1908615 [Lactarius sanguifluus]|nr:hypothetical protein EDB89DRAFT_1908615 [Lactarius sanguifluus]